MVTINVDRFYGYGGRYYGYGGRYYGYGGRYYGFFRGCHANCCGVVFGLVKLFHSGPVRIKGCTIEYAMISFTRKLSH